MRGIIFGHLFVWLLFGFCEAQEGSILDIETAWLRICHFAPSIAVTDTERQIQEANFRQASLGPNPIFSVDGQNLGVDPDIDAEAPQTTYALSQLWELGGKRAARKRLANAEMSLAYWDQQIHLQNLRCQLINAFIEVSAAQEKFQMALEKLHVASQMREAINIQVEAGKLSPIQTRKAKLIWKSAEVSLREAESKLVQEKKKLSSMWGSHCLDFECVSFDLYDRKCFCDIQDGIFQAPEFLKAQAIIFAAKQNASLQKAISVPDVTVTVGYRTYSDSDQKGWVAAFAMPIPIRDKNQGNLQRACLEVTQAEYAMQDRIRELREKSQVFYERLQASLDQADMMQKEVLEEALETFELTKTGYEKGKLQYVDLLEAHGMLFEIKEKYIDILVNYHINKAELLRICGGYSQ